MGGKAASSIDSVASDPRLDHGFRYFRFLQNRLCHLRKIGVEKFRGAFRWFVECGNQGDGDENGHALPLLCVDSLLANPRKVRATEAPLDYGDLSSFGRVRGKWADAPD